MIKSSYFTMQKGLITINTNDESYFQHDNRVYNKNHIFSAEMSVNVFTKVLCVTMYNSNGQDICTIKFKEKDEAIAFMKKFYPNFEFK